MITALLNQQISIYLITARACSEDDGDDKNENRKNRKNKEDRTNLARPVVFFRFIHRLRHDVCPWLNA